MKIARDVATKVRGVLGLGLLGTVAGVVTMAVRVTVGSFATYGLWPLPIEVSMAATAGALGGFLFGSGFGVALAVLSDRHSLLELSLRRVAVMGMVVGTAVPAVLTVVVSGADVFVTSLPGVLVESATWGAFGALLTPLSVAVARRAERIELEKTGGPLPRLASWDR